MIMRRYLQGRRLHCSWLMSNPHRLSSPPNPNHQVRNLSTSSLTTSIVHQSLNLPIKPPIVPSMISRRQVWNDTFGRSSLTHCPTQTNMLGLPCSQVRGYAAGFGRSSGPQDHKKSYQQKNKNSGQHYKPKPQVSDAYRRSRDGVKSPLLEREHANLHENPAATDPDEHVLRSPLHDILTPTTSVDPDDAIEIEDDHRTSIKKQKHHKQSLSALRINHAIPGYSSILLVRQDQAPEVMLAKDAVKIAEEEGLDLVEVSSKGPQPVCKLLDYAKHAIDMQRREIEHAKAVKKQQKVMEMKEMRMTPLTDTNDFNMKIKRVIEWLGQGRQVRVFIMFRKGQRKLVDEAFITLEAARERIKEAGSILSCTAREDQARLDEERERMGLPPKLLTLALVAAPKKQAPKDDASTPSANAPSP